MMKEIDVINGGGLGEIIEEEDEIWSSSSLSNELPILSLNHVSFICKSVSRTVKFYQEVLGFVSIRRPSSFDFQGAWLFGHGIGIHLLEMETTPRKKGVINPKDNHISFQCSDMDLIMKKLEEMGIEYVTAVVKEGGVEVNQLFFHDPDGYMIEMCNCHVLPVLPISSCPLTKMPSFNHPISFSSNSFYEKTGLKRQFCGEDEALMMMDNLLVDMMGISF